MSRYIYLLVSAALFVGIYTAAAERVRASVQRDKRATVITVNLEPQPNDRHLYVSATSENVFESSYRQLDGERRQYRIEWRRLPDDGVYEFDVRVGDSLGRIVASTSATLITMPRPE